MREKIKRIAGNRADERAMDYFANYLEANFSQDDRTDAELRRDRGFRPSGDLDDRIAPGMPVFLMDGIRVSEALGGAPRSAKKTRVVREAQNQRNQQNQQNHASRVVRVDDESETANLAQMARLASSQEAKSHEDLYNRFQEADRRCPNCRVAHLAIDDYDEAGEMWEWVCPKNRCGYRENGPASYRAFLGSEQVRTAMRNGDLIKGMSN